MLYPVELRGHEDGCRASLDQTAEGGCPYMGLVATENIWGGRRESNPQQPEPQSGALPVELLPPQPFDYNNLAGSRGAIHSAQRSARAAQFHAASRSKSSFRAGLSLGSFSGGSDDDMASATTRPM
jgi:hypothetical protein